MFEKKYLRVVYVSLRCDLEDLVVGYPYKPDPEFEVFEDFDSLDELELFGFLFLV